MTIPAGTHIHVCPLRTLPALLAETGARHLISAINNETMVATPDGMLPGNHLRLAINDITEPQLGLVHPTTEHIQDLIRFAQRWNHDGPLVVHCWAGISRSTATAYIALCALHPEGDETEIAASLRAASPIAQPNSLMIRLADEALGRRGRMIAAIRQIGQGRLALEGIPFALASRIAAIRPADARR
ncbi:MAG: tyrosine phosphatase family protein [Hyphomicrobiaceae bacterium]